MKQIWKPGNMVYPVPAVLVSCAGKNGEKNLFTVAWTGNVCTNPPMVYISIRPERYSYPMIKETEEFVINLTTEKLAKATDYCGVRSGRDTDKWKDCGLTPLPASKLEYAPVIAESPVNIECRVNRVLPLGSHDLFIADVLAVHVDEVLLDKTGKLDLASAGMLAYSHGEYRSLGAMLGTFGWSVRKKKKR